jgi:PAS domain S-box-containing protein
MKNIKKNKYLALKVALFYVFLASLWILGSDTVLSWIITDPEIYMQFQTYKGMFFVITTGFLLFIYLNPKITELNESRKNLLDADLLLKKRLDYELTTIECMRLLQEPEDIEKIIARILTKVHNTVNNSRTYIFRNGDDTELGLCMSQLYEEVSDGIEPQIDNPELQHLPYSEGAPTLLHVLLSGENYAHIVEELEEPEKSILKEQGILSVLIIPIFAGEELWGFIGFDDCTEERRWHEDDVNLLRVVADGIGEALLRKVAENKLIESEKKFRTYIEKAPYGIFIVNENGKFEEVNETASVLTGFSEDELLRMNVYSRVDPECEERSIRGIHELETKGFSSVELLIRRKNETGIWMRIDSSKLSDGRFIMFANDITEKKKAEDALIEAKMLAEENNRMKSEFLANMSHELRTPLSSIIGFSDVLTDKIFGELNEKQKRYVQHINNGGRHLLDLINDILDLSKVEAGKMELSLEVFSIYDIMEDIRSSVSPMASKKNINLEIINNIETKEISADRMKFKQIMLNLLSNAIKFTPDNGKVSVTATKKDDEITISVSDTGIGIPKYMHENIFNPFMQVDSSNKRKYGGTGLGLALVKQFVEMHGGKIWVESEEGKGSIFTFTIKDLN